MKEKYFVYEDVDKREPIFGWQNEVTKVRKFIGYRVDNERARLPSGNWILREERTYGFFVYLFSLLGLLGEDAKARMKAFWSTGVFTEWKTFEPLPAEKTMPIKKSSSADPVSEAMKVFEKK